MVSQVLASFLSWSAHWISHRWWKLPPGGVNNTSTICSISVGGSGGAAAGGISDAIEGMELLLPNGNAGNELDDGASGDARAMEQDGAVHSMQIGYAENRHRERSETSM